MLILLPVQMIPGWLPQDQNEELSAEVKRLFEEYNKMVSLLALKVKKDSCFIIFDCLSCVQNSLQLKTAHNKLIFEHEIFLINALLSLTSSQMFLLSKQFSQWDETLRMLEGPKQGQPID